MALVDYKKYQVLIKSDSKKVQGLRTGDIVRRQYFDGTNIVYSLMCVLSYGTETSKDESGKEEKRSYFIGALLEGDKLDNGSQNEVLDFARITNLFDEDRLGALYLTASDDQAPYMDVLGGIGKNKSLSWPESLASSDYEDAATQYIVKSSGELEAEYSNSSDGNSRILTVTRKSKRGYGFEGLKQDFYQFVRTGEEVLISYKIRGSKKIANVGASVAYVDDLQIDAGWAEEITTSWEYKFRAVTIEYSGRHLRSFKLDMSKLEVGESIQIADFNIILLSSVANFGDASATRVGKLDGVVDDVFGQLNGYGAYLQKLYASSSAHISGTLTAGDENGFGATFYAGKIHRNCFINSLAPDFTGSVQKDTSVVNPTGVGNVYSSSSAITMTAQDYLWVIDNVGSRYCFSFWVYLKRPATLTVSQNDTAVGAISITSEQTHKWRRVHTCFDIQKEGYEDLLIKVAPTFAKSEYTTFEGSAADPDSNVMYFTAPQLESGDTVTQYQATDDVLNTTTEYGAWFSRGGIGGTMQNPLLQLNFTDDDGNDGGIGTRSKSFLLRQDGSGYLAKKNISWDKKGKVTFSSGVTLNWDNLSGDAQDEIRNRYCRIMGEDTFSVIGYDTSAPTSPVSITLTLDEVGYTSTSDQRQWYFKNGSIWYPIENGNGTSLVVTPDSEWWGGTSGNGEIVGGETTLNIKCVVTLDSNHVYMDVKTIRKQYVQGYTLEVVSSNGNSFQNGACGTTLTANVYYQGALVDQAYAIEHFNFIWHRYRASDMTELEMNGVAEGNTLTLDCLLDSSEVYVCELMTLDAFDYSFPILF